MINKRKRFQILKKKKRKKKDRHMQNGDNICGEWMMKYGTMWLKWEMRCLDYQPVLCSDVYMYNMYTKPKKN